MQPLHTMVECIECKYKFVLVQGDVLHSRVRYQDKDGRSILLTYFDCPECGKRHIVQADNDYSLSLLLDVSKLVAKIAAKRSKGNKVPAKMQDKYHKANRHLDGYRKELMKSWTGKAVTGLDNRDAIPSLEFVVI